MQLELAYGQGYLHATVPDDTEVLRPKDVPGLSNEEAALRVAVRKAIVQTSLADSTGSSLDAEGSVVIVFSDITRPMPNDRVLPVLLHELKGVPRERIVLLNGLGTHRKQTEDELRAMLGDEIVANYAIEQHDAWDDDGLVDLGQTRFGHRAYISRTYCEAAFRIVTGFIEPHIFAGFSGGPKGILPGVAGLESIMDNHSFAMLNERTATWGVTEGNPVWEDMREVAQMAPPDLLLNVTLNRRREITGVFAGEMMEAHRRGSEFVRSSAMVSVPAPFDIVITTNSGHPLDINLYQAVKGMSCAAQIIKPGGSIIIASECRNGIPDHGEYRNLVREGGSPQGILEMVGRPGFRRHDQWEAQLQAQIQQVADVYLYSDYLDDKETRGMLFEPCHDIEATLGALMDKYGPDARVCALPEGPQTIPYLEAE